MHCQIVYRNHRRSIRDRCCLIIRVHALSDTNQPFFLFPAHFQPASPGRDLFKNILQEWFMKFKKFGALSKAIVNFREGYTSGKPQLGVCVRKVGTGQVSETTDGTGRQKGSRTRYRANFGACRYRSVIVLRNLGCNFILYFLLCSGACRLAIILDGAGDCYIGID